MKIPEDTLNSCINYCLDEYVRLTEHRAILRDHWFEGKSTKELADIKAIPTRLWAFVVAAVLMILATVFTSPEVTPGVILLTIINAVIVAMASCGEYDTLKSLRKE